MTAHPTGHSTRVEGQPAVVHERSFRAPIEDVWAAVTESDRLARWIGTWTGNPTSGSVQFQMNAEGDNVPPSAYDILHCEPPHRLSVQTGTWVLTLDLRQDGPTTILALTQLVVDPGLVESTGPGWDYYLDRLVAAETGADVDAIDFEVDYYPAMREHYLAVAKELAD
jgi:activator of Hsp90 ATPase-like protein